MIRIIIETDQDHLQFSVDGNNIQMIKEPALIKVDESAKQELAEAIKKSNGNKQASISQSGKAHVSASKSCLKCGNEFSPNGNAQRYCQDCKALKAFSISKMKSKMNKLVDDAFKTKDARISTKEKICKKCNKPFLPNGNRQVYCSAECGMIPKSEKEKKKIAIVKEKKDPLDEEISRLNADSVKRHSFMNDPKKK
jgi:hypothetical protein